VVGEQNADIANTLQLRDVAMATIFCFLSWCKKKTMVESLRTEKWLMTNALPRWCRCRQWCYCVHSNKLGMSKTDNLLSGYPFTGY